MGKLTQFTSFLEIKCSNSNPKILPIDTWCNLFQFSFMVSLSISLFVYNFTQKLYCLFLRNICVFLNIFKWAYFRTWKYENSISIIFLFILIIFEPIFQRIWTKLYDFRIKFHVSFFYNLFKTNNYIIEIKWVNKG